MHPLRGGQGGVIRAAGVVFFAYIGFDTVSTAAQEARNPQRDMPIGILGSLVICTILYKHGKGADEMSIIVAMLALMTSVNQDRPRADYFLPISLEVEMATKAARHAGYYPNRGGIFLDELRDAEGKDPIPGYKSIGLYRGGSAITSYAIRIDTGDVIDDMSCTVLRYPDLLKYKREFMKIPGTKAVPLDQLATEVGCEKLEVVPKMVRKKSK